MTEKKPDILGADEVKDEGTGTDNGKLAAVKWRKGREPYVSIGPSDVPLHQGFRARRGYKSKLRVLKWRTDREPYVSIGPPDVFFHYVFQVRRRYLELRTGWVWPTAGKWVYPDYEYTRLMTAGEIRKRFGRVHVRTYEFELSPLSIADNGLLQDSQGRVLIQELGGCFNLRDSDDVRAVLRAKELIPPNGPHPDSLHAEYSMLKAAIETLEDEGRVPQGYHRLFETMR